MKKCNQEFWLRLYTNKAVVIDWYKNYKTYWPEGKYSEEEMKQMFLEGEKIQIYETFGSQKFRDEAYNFIKEVIENL